MTIQTKTQPPIHGTVAPGFEAVQAEFVRNFTERGELGAACAIYHRGQKVVDLWGGYRDSRTQAPWEEDTIVLVFSSTKGIAGLTMAVAQSRGLFDYNAPVATYWPEFAQAGKERITIRQLLAHEAGLCVIDKPLTVEILADHDALAAILASQKPAWEPGTRHGYHAFSLGWYESEIIRRTDPQHRTLGQFFHDELAKPLGLEFYISVPQSVSVERIATVTEPPIMQKLLGMPFGMMLGALNPRSLTIRTANPRFRSNLVLNTPAYWSVEMPSAGGIGDARSIAKAYSVFATGGQELGIAPQTLADVRAAAVPPVPGGWHDVILHTDMAYSLGFLKPFPGYHSPPRRDNPLRLSGGRDDRAPQPGQPQGIVPTRVFPGYHFGSSDAAYGGPGSGGSFGFADPDAQVGYAYVMNKQSAGMFDDPREKALRDAFYQCLHTRGNAT